MGNVLVKLNPREEFSIQLALNFARENNIEDEVQIFTGEEINSDEIKVMIADDENNVIILTKNEEYILLSLEEE